VHEACGEPLHAYFICLCPAGHWLGPVTWPGWLGPAQPQKIMLGRAQPSLKNKKSRKIKNKKYVCMDKNNVNLLVYSLMPESGIKYRFKFILFLFVVFYFI
jgi:hypothetical protein